MMLSSDCTGSTPRQLIKIGCVYSTSVWACTQTFTKITTLRPYAVVIDNYRGLHTNFSRYDNENLDNRLLARDTVGCISYANPSASIFIAVFGIHT
jgi:hypothetical protein